MRRFLPLGLTPLLLLHASDSGRIVGWFGVTFILTVCAWAACCCVLAHIAGSSTRRALLRTRLSVLPVISLATLIGCSIVIWCFFQNQFLLSLKFHANAILLCVLLLATVVLYILSQPSPQLAIRKIALSAASMVLALMAVEFALRAITMVRSRGFERLDAHAAGLTDLTQSVTLGQVIRPCPNPRRVYEFVPSSRFRFIGVPVSINSDGFRGREHAISKPTSTIRIVGLGDSVMFGWGVQEDESYLSIVEQDLNGQQDGLRWEVINTGVPGYNTVMEVETLKDKGLKYQPDLVVINYVLNDMDLPHFIRDERHYTDLGQSYLQRLMTGKNWTADALIDAPGEAEEGRMGVVHDDDVPPRYRDLVGVEAYRKAMEELRLLSNEHGFAVLVLSHKSLPDAIRAICRDLGFPQVETAPLWDDYCAKTGIKDPQQAFGLSKQDRHPTALAHRIVARALLNGVEGWRQSSLSHPSGGSRQ